MTKVTLYSQDNCGHCLSTKEWLEANEVDFVEVDVRKDEEAFNAIVDRGFNGTPVVSVNDFEKSWAGYDTDKLSTLIDDEEEEEDAPVNMCGF